MWWSGLGELEMDRTYGREEFGQDFVKNDFAIYGSWDGLDGCKTMPRGVGSFSTPGKPTSENSFFGPSRA